MSPARRVLISSLLVCLGGFLFGYNTGVVAGALLFLEMQFTLTISEQAWVVSAFLLGAIFSAPLAGVMTQKWGRIPTIFIAAVLLVVGGGELFYAWNYVSLLWGRWIQGIAIGLSSVVIPMYLAEINPTKKRGFGISLHQLAITIGLAFAYGASTVLVLEEGWRWMFGLSVIPALILFLALFFLDETPRSLIQRGQLQKALFILKKIREPEEIEEDLLEPQVEQKPSWSLLKHPKAFRIFAIGIGMVILQQVSGINAIVCYLPTILTMGGMGTLEQSMRATFCIGLVNILATVFSVFLIDRLGRKKILFLGLFLTILGLSMAVLLYQFSLASEIKALLLVLFLALFIVGFAIGLGPVTWLVMAEIFPTPLRSVGMSLCTMLLWVFSFLITLFSLSLFSSLGEPGVFACFTAVALFTFFFVFKWVPETKGKSLNQLDREWDAAFER